MGSGAEFGMGSMEDVGSPAGVQNPVSDFKHILNMVDEVSALEIEGAVSPDVAQTVRSLVTSMVIPRTLGDLDASRIRHEAALRGVDVTDRDYMFKVPRNPVMTRDLATARFTNGRTLLSYAMEHNDSEAAVHLLAAGADMHAKAAPGSNLSILEAARASVAGELGGSTASSRAMESFVQATKQVGLESMPWVDLSPEAMVAKQCGVRAMGADDMVKFYHGTKQMQAYEGPVFEAAAAAREAFQQSGLIQVESNYATMSLQPERGWWTEIGFEFEIPRRHVRLPGESNPDALVEVKPEGYATMQDGLEIEPRKDGKQRFMVDFDKFKAKPISNLAMFIREEIDPIHGISEYFFAPIPKPFSDFTQRLRTVQMEQAARIDARAALPDPSAPPAAPASPFAAQAGQAVDKMPRVPAENVSRSMRLAVLSKASDALDSPMGTAVLSKEAVGAVSAMRSFDGSFNHGGVFKSVVGKVFEAPLGAAKRAYAAVKLAPGTIMHGLGALAVFGAVSSGMEAVSEAKLGHGPQAVLAGAVSAGSAVVAAGSVAGLAGIARAAALTKAVGPVGAVLGYAGSIAKAREAMASAGSADPARTEALWTSAKIKAAGATGSVFAGMAAGAAIGSAFPLAGTIVGAAVGTVVAYEAEMWPHSVEEHASSIPPLADLKGKLASRRAAAAPAQPQPAVAGQKAVGM